jgi:large subunit ribosomal protein L21
LLNYVGNILNRVEVATPHPSTFAEATADTQLLQGEKEKMNMTNAVIETGGKQYLVALKDRVTIEKLDDAIAGDMVSFDKVLLVVNDSNVYLGKPYLAEAKVTAKVLSQGRGKKLVVFKYRAKSRYRRKQGHRQSETVVEIESIA